MKNTWMKFIGAVAIIALPMLSHAACPSGYPEVLQPDSADQKLDAPTGFEQGTAQFSLGGAKLGDEMSAANAQASGAAADALKNGKTVDLTWRHSGQACAVKVSLKASSSPPGVTSGDDTTECARAADVYAASIQREHDIEGNGHFALVVFCESGTTLQLNSRRNDVVSVGDTIYAAVFVDPTHQTHINFQWPSCAARDSAPKRFGTDDFGVAQVTSSPGMRMIPEEPIIHRRCFNTDPQVKVTGTGTSQEFEDLDRTETVTQYERFNYSFQLGALFTDEVDRKYSVAEDNEGVSRIVDGGPEGKGPQYFAALTMYGLPYQICDLFNGCKDHSPYLGRDLVNEASFLDRINGILGVGLENPGDEFVAGIGIEVLRGFNVIGVWRTAKLNVLNGVAVGDEFIGDADAIPKKEKWEDGFFLGFSIDLGYAAGWFKR